MASVGGIVSPSGGRATQLTIPPSHDAFSRPTARLEALRGLAAIQVAFLHSLQAFESIPCNREGLATLYVLFNGGAAVTLFFVLSGFVLGLSLRRASGGFGEIYLRFAVRRVFRIWPVVVVSSVVVSCFLLFCHFHPTQSSFINAFVYKPVTVTSFLEQLFFIQFLNPVTWTLRMEMICSLLLPLAFFVEKLRPSFLPLILVMLLLLAALLPTVISIMVMPAFFLGFILPLTAGWWQSVQRSRSLNALLLLLGGIALLLPRSFDPPVVITTQIEAIGAFLIIGAIVLGAPLAIFKALDFYPIRTAGRLSYSYYVYHPVCLVITGHLILPELSHSFLYHYPAPTAFLLWFASSLAAFPLAALSYATVEKPLINYARKLCP